MEQAGATRAPTTSTTSTILAKATMAVSGAVWLGFLVAHLGTNIRVFSGAEAINSRYAEIKDNDALFWGVRAVLLIAFVLHVVTAIILARRSKVARPVTYRKRKAVSSSLASRTMLLSGPALGFFIIYHLAHLTTGAAMTPAGAFDPENQYGNIVVSFSQWYVVGIYLVSLILLGFHLWHGALSALLSLGLRHPKYDSGARWILRVLVLVVTLGMLSIPLGVMSGWV